MKDKFKLVVDASSIVKSFMYLKDEEFGEEVEFEGKLWMIPALETAMENFEGSVEKTLRTFELKYKDIIWVNDPEKGGQARRLMFGDYRKGRTKKPLIWFKVCSDLLDGAKEFVMKKGAVSATPTVKPAVEADDLCNEICNRFPKTILWAKDKDLLAANATIHYQDGEVDPMKFPCEREHIHLYRTLVLGDKSDGIGSCKGFGVKAWEKIIAGEGYEAVIELQRLMDNHQLHLLANSDYRELDKVVAQAEDLYHIYSLFQFMAVPANKVQWRGSYLEGTDTLVVSDNFEECLAEVQQLIETEDYSVIDYESDNTDERSEPWLKGTGKDKKSRIKVDIPGSRPTGLGVRIGYRNFYFCTNHADTNNIPLEDLGKVIHALKHKRTVAHNSTGFENVMTYQCFGVFMKHMWDSILMGKYVDEDSYNGLKGLSELYLNFNQITYEETIGDRSGMSEVTGEEVLDYGLGDVITNDAIYNIFMCILQYEGTLEVFEEVEVLSSFFTSMMYIQGVDFDPEAHAQLVVENEEKKAKLVPHLAELLGNVGWIDPNGRKPIKTRNASAARRLYLAVTGEELVSDSNTIKDIITDIDNEEVRAACESGAPAMDALEAEFYVGPELPINFGSPTQMVNLFFKTMELPIRKRNKTTKIMRAKGTKGTPKTDEKMIENALAFGDATEEGEELMRGILAYKGCLTRDSLFLSKYPGYPHWKTNKIHSSQMQCGTNTRRHAASKPNVLQLPKRKGKEVRNMLVAPDGYSFVDLDFSGQELRLAAWFTQCKAFLSCFVGALEDRRDVHSLTGMQIAKFKEMGVETYEDFVALVEAEDKMAKEYRGKGKNTNFSCNYGTGIPSLAWGLFVSEADAKGFFDAREKAFPGITPAVKTYHKLCRKRGYATTFLGARRHLAKKYAMAGKDDYARSAVDRLAFSFCIQGSAAEQTKLAMSRIVKATNFFEDDSCLPVFQIYDELVMVVKDELVEEYTPILHDLVCRQYADMEIEIESDPEVGKSFGSLKKYKM